MATSGDLERRSREVARDEVDRTLQYYAKREWVSEELRKSESRLTRWVIGSMISAVLAGGTLVFLALRFSNVDAP